MKTVFRISVLGLLAVAGDHFAQAQTPVTTTTTGTNGVIPVFTTSTNIENSVIQQSGSSVGIGGTPSKTLHVHGHAQFELPALSAFQGDGPGRFHFVRPSANPQQYENFLSFNNGATYQWLIGMDNTTTNDFRIFGPSAISVLTITGSNGNIGMGLTSTTSPLARLHVVGNAVFTNSSSTPFYAPYIKGGHNVTSATTPDYTWYGDMTTGMYHPGLGALAFSTDGAARLYMTSDGKIGMGTTTPQVSLQLNGDMQLGSITTGERWMFHTRDWADGDQFWIGHDNGSGTFTYDFGIQRSTGNVSIGASMGDAQFANYRLSVNGKIRAKEIVVETGWSDFVFEEDYRLRPLEEVEAFIAANKHLPEIPSAAEVEANGVSVGQMESKLLQKVEELTLYIIDQNKRMEAQEQKIGLLENELKELKRD